MPYNFNYLIEKSNEAGAREEFEDICRMLLEKLYSDVSQIEPCQGDGGIDVMVGKFTAPIKVFQCKYFPRNIGESQKEQIRDSFRHASNGSRFRLTHWTLCASCILTLDAKKWFDTWAAKKQKETGVVIELWDGGKLVGLLRDHGLYERVFHPEMQKLLEANEQQLAHNRKLTDTLEKLLQSVALSGDITVHKSALILSPEMIAQAQCDCSADDLRKYYAVDNSFQIMLRVISAGGDVPNPEAEETVFRGLEEGRPVILAGNGGMGKSSLMLRCAVRWVRSGSPAVWLSLSERSNLTEQEIKSLCSSLRSSITDDQRLLLCIDDPYEGREALRHLRSAIGGEPRIQLITAERSNRLSILTHRNNDYLSDLFDRALAVVLDCSSDGRSFNWSNFDVVRFSETTDRRVAVLGNCLHYMESEGFISTGLGKPLLDATMLGSRSPMSAWWSCSTDVCIFPRNI